MHRDLREREDQHAWSAGHVCKVGVSSVRCSSHQEPAHRLKQRVSSPGVST